MIYKNSILIPFLFEQTKENQKMLLYHQRNRFCHRVRLEMFRLEGLISIQLVPLILWIHHCKTQMLMSQLIDSNDPSNDLLDYILKFWL